MTKMIRSVNPTEHQIQCAIIEWANKTKFNEIIIGDYLIAIPNGGYRNKLEAKRLQMEGVKSGVFDMFLAIPTMTADNVFLGGCWIELKSKNGTLTHSQKFWGKRMIEGNYGVFVCYGVDEGIQAIKDYLGVK